MPTTADLSRTQRKPRWQGSTLQLDGGRRSCSSSASTSQARPRLASRANSSSMHRRMLEFWAPMAPRRRDAAPGLVRTPAQQRTAKEGGDCRGRLENEKGCSAGTCSATAIKRFSARGSDPAVPKLQVALNSVDTRCLAAKL